MIRNFKAASRAVLSAVALLVLFTTSAMAQDRVAEGAKKVTDGMKTQLTLNDSQYAKVLEINKAYLVKVKESKAKSVNKVEAAKKLKTIDEDREAKLKSVLTADQYKAFAATRADNKKKLKEYLEEKQG
ncbi:hypothetical protein [Flavobacterium subsaxonicum]|uniref:DUF4168 domain-containing protein n=1 Tax=Flavobacterium subsaxonicum WB 4.1-42 = DSM 21790 TaxID=1121898 RepID=A0A0A2MEG9_9FLAO|nr:hypothetical protein [Flavobacterium subsaxonicum]KGO91087.1 hypothetical protein Q766_20000 [Flavobacterium subsaxonicum WB 4.1-42 = DSM 21790]